MKRSRAARAPHNAGLRKPEQPHSHADGQSVANVSQGKQQEIMSDRDASGSNPFCRECNADARGQPHKPVAQVFSAVKEKKEQDDDE
jgi:hypothetical protein